MLLVSCPDSLYQEGACFLHHCGAVVLAAKGSQGAPSPRNCSPLSGNYLLLEVICPLLGKGSFQPTIDMVLKTGPLISRYVCSVVPLMPRAPRLTPAEVTSLLGSVLCRVCFSCSHSPEIPPPLDYVHRSPAQMLLPGSTRILLVCLQKCLVKKGQRLPGSGMGEVERGGTILFLHGWK